MPSTLKYIDMDSVTYINGAIVVVTDDQSATFLAQVIFQFIIWRGAALRWRQDWSQKACCICFTRRARNVQEKNQSVAEIGRLHVIPVPALIVVDEFGARFRFFLKPWRPCVLDHNCKRKDQTNRGRLHGARSRTVVRSTTNKNNRQAEEVNVSILKRILPTNLPERQYFICAWKNLLPKKESGRCCRHPRSRHWETSNLPCPRQNSAERYNLLFVAF